MIDRMDAFGRKELPDVNRQYKARLFEMIFSQKKELLELYNAVSGSNYTDPDKLEINTLENAIYMAMRNDVSFVIDFRLSLYEHQSTFNPNIPLRLLMYIADLYSKITHGKNLYGETAVPIPTPNFIVFYNGKDEYPDRMTLKLSDMYQVKQDEAELGLKVTMLNINRGRNKDLMASCKTLADYAEYTARVREYTRSMPLDEAVERAITECISEGILSEFLTAFRAEAKSVSIYEYNEEEHMRMEREEHYAKGKADGRAEGKKEERARIFVKSVCKKIRKGNTVAEIADMLEMDTETVQRIYDTAAGYFPDYDEDKILKKYLTSTGSEV